MLGLYIHIPFCKHICSYCDFPKKVPYNELQITKYIDKLISELAKYSKYYKDCDTIYIGGGTPNLLSDYELERLLKEIAKYKIKYQEYSIECNPELITENQIKLFKKYGINRISLGMQTTSNLGLKLLNRYHNKEDVEKSIHLLKKYNLNNINLDLIYGCFNQTMTDLKNDLDFIKEMDVKHVSAYTLILEEKTKLSLQYKEKDFDEDLIADMTILVNSELRQMGFEHYEISNYAKPKYESIHNLKYWNKEEYIGLGMGGCSYLNHQRITNPSLINLYLKDAGASIENLSTLDEKKEYIILGLRKIVGINKNDYIKRFNSCVTEDFNYQKLINYDLLYEDENILKLTDKGLMLANVVFEEFL